MAIRQVLLAFWILGVTSSAAAQGGPFHNRTPNTITAAAEVPSPPATLKELAWLAGRWTGPGLGGVCEETWSEPAGGAMLGMFRLLRDGKPVFYELLTFVEQGGSLLLRLKHFNPDLTGWEEKADSISFRLLKLAPDTLHFDGLTFKRVGDDLLEVFLAIRNRTDNSVREERFEMRRVN